MEALKENSTHIAHCTSHTFTHYAAKHSGAQWRDWREAEQLMQQEN